MQMNLTAVIGKVKLNSAFLITERHDWTHIFIRHKNSYRINRFTNFGNLVDRRQLGRILHVNHFAIAQKDFIYDTRGGRDQIHVVFALKSLLDNIHVQQTEEAGAEPET